MEENNDGNPFALMLLTDAQKVDRSFRKQIGEGEMGNHKVLRCYSTIDERILLDFYPLKNKGPDMSPADLCDFDGERLVVYQTDYDKLLIDYFKRVFPLLNPTDGEMQEDFDVCWDNWVSAESWNDIIANMQKDICRPLPTNELGFYMDFIGWIKQQLTWADLIVIDGNQ